MRAFTVCVGYAEALGITAPYNAHHFTERYVITSHEDIATQKLCNSLGITTHVTDAFYKDCGHFRKWLALEEALDVFGRGGWLCLLDADVLWPKNAAVELVPGTLLSPLRRMCQEVRLVSEAEWQRYPIHRNVGEYAGYTQVFHGEDPVLGTPPWHDTSWIHAGGADSFFQRKWPENKKKRPPWEVLHLGPAGTNWCGVGKSDTLNALMVRRRTTGFDAEKLK